MASFDVVLIQEQMKESSESIQMFHEMIGYPREEAPAMLKNDRVGSERAKYYQPPDNTTLQRLREWNVLDIELYDYAVKLSSS